MLLHRCHYYVRIDSTSVRFLRKRQRYVTKRRRNIQASNCVSKGTFPSFLSAIPTSPHDALLIPPNGIARRIKVRASKDIHILIRVIRIRQRYVRLVGHNSRVLGSAQTHRLLLLCKDGLLRSCGTRGGTLEGLGARLRNESCGVRVAIFQIVDQRATLALARIAFLFFGPTELLCAQLAFASLGLFLFLERLRVRLFALLIEFDERRVFFSVGGDARLRFGDVDIVDEVEGLRMRK
jgi:hypothetical protein